MMMKKIITIVTALVLSGMLMAQGEMNEAEAEALAKVSQNPLAKMVSVPFQNNTTYNNEPSGGAVNVFNVQPVVPFTFGEVNMINRMVAPIITKPSSTTGVSTTGLGDISLTSWFAPAKAGSILWGVGPALQLPTSSSREFGSGEFGVGPSLVALTMIDKWVGGFVVNNVWTFGDISENKFLLQYFVNYNLPHAAYVVTAPILTANWNAVDGEKWTVPVGGGVGKIFKFGKFPVNANAQVYYNVVSPTGVGNWQSRVQLQFMFPK